MLPEKTASYTLLDDSARTTSWYTSVWKPTVLIAFAILICVSIVVVLYVDENNQNDGYQWVKMRMSEFQSMFPKNDSAVDLITNQTTPSSALPTTLYVAPTSLLGCELKRMDPWDPEIEYYIDPNYKPNCKANRTQISQFVGGKILINSTEHTCQGRCLLPKNDWEHVKGNWEPVTTFNAKCDIVEVECNKTATNTIDYNYLHSQIYEREDDTNYGSHKVNQTKIPGRKVTSHFERPNIYLILFDSTSTTQFIRSMAKTFYYLKERHEATIIEHLNKVGINSRPNAWALMFSKQVYELGKNPYVDEMLPELNHTMNCVNANDDQDWWGHRLRDLGYHTMIGEDWASGALNWPNCWGFKRPAAKHYMKPFQRRNEEQGGEIIRKTITEMCHETYQDLFPYLDQFMSAYKNQSEFAWIWNSELAHNYVNGLYHADETLYRLLMKHEDRLNNSFVFMQGDHGMRFGGIRSTAHGEMEDNNPLLMISVPVKYRNTNLPKVLKENAKKLITHYDSYASLMHLVELITNNTLDEELSNPKPQEFQRGHGSSYFRARMNEPRDCGTLRIPYEYCLCDKKFEDPLKTDLQLTKDLGQYAIEYFQSEIDVENVTSRCQPATVLHEKTVAEKLVLSDAREIYRLKFTATPEERIFSGFVEVHRKNGTVERIEKMSKRFDRLNSYGDQGECVKAFEELRPVCYCKNYKKQ
ncbi:hypothetical protein L596_013421 [Steinernema carpocapsae]|uniref:Uncharacterized protein n=1 Tax=Steinernema carpocapsae TaxID=34508 RepID=A0A4V6A528_STECR|nr:hypothetical protein L596_013421 [Steinernema carpocapsae]